MLVKLIDDLLDVSRITTGKIVLQTRARRPARGRSTAALEGGQTAVDAAPPRPATSTCRRRPSG